MPKTSKGITVKVDGRTFLAGPTTMEQDGYIMEYAVRSGLDQHKMELTGDSKDLERGVKLILIEAYRSGTIFHLMSGLLVEEGTDWSRAAADANADLFRTTRDPDAKQTLQPALVASVLAFFESGGGLDATSLGALIQPEDEEPSVARTPKITSEQAGAVFRGELGSLSSAKSPSSTVRRQKSSPA